MPLDQFTPLSADVLECPHPFNARMRREAPIYRCPHTGMFFVFDYETIKRIAGDPATFSNKFRTGDASHGRHRSALDRNTKGRIPAGRYDVDRRSTGAPSLSRPRQSGIHRAACQHAGTRHRKNRQRSDRHVRRSRPVRTRRRVLWSAAFDRNRRSTGRATDGPAVVQRMVRCFRCAAVAHGVAGRRDRSGKTDRRVPALLREKSWTSATPIAKDDIVSDIVHARLEGERPLDTASHCRSSNNCWLPETRPPRPRSRKACCC